MSRYGNEVNEIKVGFMGFMVGFILGVLVVLALWDYTDVIKASVGA